MASPVAGINDHRQVGFPVQIRNTGKRQSKACVPFERANSTFAQHDLRISLIENVFCSQQKLVHRCRSTTFQQNRFARSTDSLKQAIILHIPGPNLQYISVSGDQIHIIRPHHLGKNREIRFLPCRGKHFQAVFFEALKTVGAGSRLECPPSQSGRTCSFDCSCSGQDLLFVLHTTWPRNDPHLTCTGDKIQHTNLCCMLLDFTTRHLVRRGDRHHGGNPRAALNRFLEMLSFIANCGHDGAFGSDNHVRFQPHAFHALNGRLDLGICRIGFHHNNHHFTLVRCFYSNIGTGKPDQTRAPFTLKQATHPETGNWTQMLRPP